MRVVAGRFGGRRLVAPRGGATRPVTDRVKEAVFSSLADRIEGAAVADLYAGSGSFGIESLSRGARLAVFVETDPSALEALRRNLGMLGLGEDVARVVPTTVESFLLEAPLSFDLVFCDPPWSLDAEHLAGVLDRVPLAPGAQVVVSRRWQDPVPQPARLRIYRQRRYGDTRIVRYVESAEEMSR